MARAAAPDLVVLGRQVGNGQARAEQVGRRFLVAGADELQRVGRIDVVLRAARARSSTRAGPRRRRCGGWRSTPRVARLDEELEALDGRAERAAPIPAFVAAKKRERDGCSPSETKSSDAPWTPPADRQLLHQPADPAAPQPAARREDRRGDAQARRADRRDQPARRAAAAAAPSRGAPFFVGDAKCARLPQGGGWPSGRRPCTRRPGRRWSTVGKQNDYKCISCHVTGYGAGRRLQPRAHRSPARRAVRDLPRPRVDARRREGARGAVVGAHGRRRPAPASAATPSSTRTRSSTRPTCATSSAPGHGAAARKKLGDGPTGHALRSAALARAKAAGAAEADRSSLEAGCVSDRPSSDADGGAAA